MMCIIDYSLGNIGSLVNMCRYIGIETIVGNDRASIESATHLILPGVGAFDKAISNLKTNGLFELVDEVVKNQNKPILGLCLGAQIMLGKSEEGKMEGFGWVPGEVVRFQLPKQFKIPHMGWNEVHQLGAEGLFNDMPDANPRFYFVHSYHFSGVPEDYVACKSTYGNEFVSGFRKRECIRDAVSPGEESPVWHSVITQFLRYSMKRARIIPVLLLKNQGLCKTIKFGKDRYIGDPLNAVKIFNDKQCDELVLLDVLASKENKGINYKKIEEIALECFMPLAYGGGIKELEHIEKILKLGVEKVILNSILLEKPNFLKEAVREFGSSTIVASVDLKKNLFGKYGVYSHVGKKTPSDLYDFLDAIEKDDAGEMMINVVDLDGMQSGYDFKLADKLSERYSMPITWCGGCSGFEDMRNLIENTQVSAAAAGSYFIYKGALQAVLINYPRPDEIGSIRV